MHKLCQEAAPKILAEFKPHLMIAIGGGGYVPARILRSFLKQPGSPNIPIQAIGLSLYEQLADAPDAEVEAARTQVTRTQWLDLSALGEMADLVGKRVLIVDEVDDTRTTLEYAVRELQKDVEQARARLGSDQKTEFAIFVLHVRPLPFPASPHSIHPNRADTRRQRRTRTRRRRAPCPTTSSTAATLLPGRWATSGSAIRGRRSTLMSTTGKPPRPRPRRGSFESTRLRTRKNSTHTHKTKNGDEIYKRGNEESPAHVPGNVRRVLTAWSSAVAGCPGFEAQGNNAIGGGKGKSQRSGRQVWRGFEVKRRPR